MCVAQNRLKNEGSIVSIQKTRPISMKNEMTQNLLSPPIQCSYSENNGYAEAI